MTRRMVQLVDGGSITVDDHPEDGRAVVRVWSAAYRFLGYQVRDAPIGTAAVTRA